jgi:hypothetical protein
MLLAAAVVLGALIVIPVLHHFQLKRAVERYQAELKTKGVPMELTQILPPPVASAHDGTELFLKASALIMKDPSCLGSNTIYLMRMVAPGKAMVLAGQPDVRDLGYGGYTNSWKTIRAATEQNQEAGLLFDQILQRPEMDFHIGYENGFYDTNFFHALHLVEMKRSAQWLNGAVAMDLHDGKGEDAVRKNAVSLTLVHAAQGQRLIISELVRIACAAIAQGATWEILQSPNVTDAQLQMLQTNWTRLDFLQGYQDALNMERIVGDIELARWRDSSREMDKLFELFENASKTMGNYEEPTLLQRANLARQRFLWRYWWSYPDKLRSLKGYAALLEAAHQAETNRVFQPAFKQQESRLDDLGISALKDSIESVFSGEIHLESMLSASIQSMGKVFKKVMVAETGRQITITAIALKRWQLKHGSYPADLASLVPEFLAAVPLDPVNGQPLRYHLNADGTFTLYSIGENGRDDGGNPALADEAKSKSLQWQNSNALDWVWPQPATAAEVEAYFAKQAKTDN